jgi:hypothetical protein
MMPDSYEDSDVNSANGSDDADGEGYVDEDDD